MDPKLLITEWNLLIAHRLMNSYQIVTISGHNSAQGSHHRGQSGCYLPSIDMKPDAAPLFFS